MSADMSQVTVVLQRKNDQAFRSVKKNFTETHAGLNLKEVIGAVERKYMGVRCMSKGENFSFAQGNCKSKECERLWCLWITELGNSRNTRCKRILTHSSNETELFFPYLIKDDP